MAGFIFPGRHLNELSVLLYFVLLFCCHVSCVLVNVTRKEQDIFSYPGIFGHNCAKFCRGKESFFDGSSPKYGICVCECSFAFKTFVTAELKCMKDKDIRNTSKLTFLLNKNEKPTDKLKVISFDSRKTEILYDVPSMADDKKCALNNIEALSHENVQEWDSVKRYLNYDLFELDDDHIEKTYTWINIKYEGWQLLTLKWRVNPDMFVGRIMRLNVTCKGKSSGRQSRITGLMVFKVNGTFRFPDNTIASSTLAPTVSTTYHLSPTPSRESTVSVYSTTTIVLSVLPTTVMSSPLISMSSPLISMRSPLISMTSPLMSMTSSSLISTTSSSLQPMTSPSLIPMMSSTPQPMTSSTSSSSRSSSTSSSSRSSSDVETIGLTYSLTLSSMVLSSSSMAVVGPPKASKSSSTAAVTGGVVAGVVVLLLIVVLLVYVLRKRRMTIMRRKHSDLGHINPNYPSLSSLTVVIPALNNPLNDGIYENPEVVNDERNRRSGVMSIGSAAYDACLIVENPSANREAKSVYDNIPDPPENTYKALDPAKREPSVKYQSLIKPGDHEYYTVADSVSGAPMQEPLYSEIDRLPSPVPIRNGHGPSAPTLPPLNPRKPPNSTKAESIYNELENSGEGVKSEESTNPVPPSIPPREDLTSQPPLSPEELLSPAEPEQPIYDELENSGEGVKSEESTNPVPPSIPPREDLTSQPPLSPAEPEQLIYNEFENSGEGVKSEESTNPVPPSIPSREDLTSQPPLSPAEPEQPIYNEFENSGEGVKSEESTNPVPPSIPPREALTSQPPHSPEELLAPAEPEQPIYNELEDSRSETKEDEKSNEVTNGLEESTEIDDENGLVYSVLEDK